MISNQILQNTIDGLKGITRVDLCVMDMEGQVLASTEKQPEGLGAEVTAFITSPADSQVVHGYQFFKVFDDNQLEYILLAKGSNDDVYMVGKLAAFQLGSLLTAYKERFDKDNFIKNLLLDNLLLVDIYNRAKKLHIATEVRRVVFIIESSRERVNTALDNVRNQCGSKSKDFITAVDEKNVIVVKELSPGEGYDEMYTAAKIMKEAACVDGEEVHVALGTIVGEIKEVSRSYKEARMALDVGKIFFDDRDVIAYSSLGIGRLIYQLPMPLCEMFMKEVFGGKLPESLDDETLNTINKFFDNNLNISETSRQLFLHRNTLVYRLEKIQKSTGLDIRVFDDALTFKIALMVSSYMDFMNNQD